MNVVVTLLCLIIAIIYLRGCACAYCVSQSLQRTNTSRCITIDELLKGDVDLLSPFTLRIDGLVELHVPLRFNDLTGVSLIGQNNGVFLCSNYSGVSFFNVTGLIIENLTFQHCSLLSNSTGTNVSNNFSSENKRNWLYPSAVYIEKCSNVTIKNSAFTYNYGVGLSIYDSVGIVNMQECNFQANKILTEVDTLPGGGGLHIELTTCPPGIYSSDRSNYCTASDESDQNKNTLITISKCTFANNNSTTIDNSKYVMINSGVYQKFGRGGGLIFIAEGAAYVELKLIDCIFRGNSAQWGGGMLVLFTEKASSAHLMVHNCSFVNNSGRSGGGGVQLQLSHTVPVKGITMDFQSCNFMYNSAHIGGGFILLTREHYQSSNSTLLFQHCTWRNNSARYSAAMDLSRTQRSSYTKDALTPRFSNCSFANNYVLNSTTKIKDSSANYTGLGKGTLMALYFTVVFEIHICFKNNLGSALYLLSSNATFSSGITAVFSQNHGINGAAFCLKASSFIRINPNSTFDIHNNTASSVGGAIFHSGIGEHELHDITHTCIFDAELNVDNVHINFSGNRQHNNTINSVYASPLYACVQNCTSDTFITSEMLLLCNSGVEFDDDNTLQIQGEGSNIEMVGNLSESLKVFPGISFSLSFHLTDARKNRQTGSFMAEIVSGNNVMIPSDYAYSIGKQMKLLGKSGSKAKLSFRSRNHRSFEVTFDIELLQCPPGLHLDTDGNSQCICRFNGTSIYRTIICSSRRQKALIISGYWAGYIGHTTPSPSTFYTAICPIGFCQYNNNSVKSLYSLPQSLSMDKIDTFMCGSSRTGVLCGDCRKGHSVHYHSPTLECKKDKLCEFGWLLYIVSELLPLTVLFAVIILFNIKVTSGTANGFIFYCQVVSVLVVSSYRKDQYLSSELNILIEIYLFIYRCFNMEFFKHSHLSFCLWKGATTLDIVAFTYITIVYAFFLVIFTVVLLKYCTCCLRCSYQQKSTSYAIHGISTFLILCYVHCTRVSFQILTSSNPIGAMQVYIKRRRVFYNGNYEYFDKHHIIYAIPASMCIVIIVIPPILLLWYPLGPKLLQKCGLGESRVLTLFSKVVPLHKLQPFMDSFQSCYRDNCRFVSGLYFLYRMAVLAAFAGATGFDQFYSSVQVLLVGMTLLHAIAQPYKNWWHNVSDALLFAILSTINALSVYIVSQLVRPDEIARKNILYASIFQHILVNAPLISLLIYSKIKLIIIIRAKCRWRKDLTEADELTDFPARLIYSDVYESDTEATLKSRYIKKD